MELRHLQYFLMVAREGTISGAANVLHISQPSLSRQMQDLEHELGCKLFERGSRRIELIEQNGYMWIARICESGKEIEVWEDEFELDD